MIKQKICSVKLLVGKNWILILLIGLSFFNIAFFLNFKPIQSGIEKNDFSSATSDELEIYTNLRKDLLDIDKYIPNKLPFSGFIKNIGQINSPTDEIQYYYRATNFAMGFSSSKIHYALNISRIWENIDITFFGANNVNPQGFNEKTHKTNYYYGKSAFKDVRSFNEILYKNIYPNIDIKYYNSYQGLKYEFIVHSGGDPSKIQIKVSDNVPIFINDNEITIQLANVEKLMPIDSDLFSFIKESKQKLDSKFNSLGNNCYGISISQEYPIDSTLIIDPTVFATYIGATGNDYITGLEIDHEGNIYTSGSTTATDYPLSNPYNATFGGATDIFINKFTPDGQTLLFSTYIGGSLDDSVRSSAMDSQGNIVVTGTTYSANFPMVNAFDDTLDLVYDAIVLKLSPDGQNLLYSTYLGGNNEDWGESVTVDQFDNIYVVGRTNSTDYPMVNAIDSTYNGGTYDSFVTKIASNGTTLLYSSYIGGEGDEFGSDIEVDQFENMYLLGHTNSADYPTFNAFQSTYGGGAWDAFLTKLNADGSNYIFSTFLGGSLDDSCGELNIDNSQNVYVVGTTSSSDFPTINAYQSVHGGSMDVFATKFTPNGTSLYFSTYIGGSAIDQGFALDVDNAGNVYITGRAQSIPTTPDAIQSSWAGGTYEDLIISKISHNGSKLLYSTFVGSTNRDYGNEIKVDYSTDAIIVGGTTFSTGMYVVNDFQGVKASGADSYLIKIDNPSTPSIIIDGNADFIDQAFIRGWSGSGTSNDQIIIENFAINTGPKNGFSIGNTTLHFIVRNVTVENMASGFYLENVSNAYLENNTASNNNWAGIRLYNSSNNILIKNTANSNVDYGIYLHTSSDYNTLTGNTINSNFQGIRVNTKYNSISNNTARFNSNDGIYLGMAAHNNTILNNSALFNSRDGIYMYSSSNNIISSNTMNNNTRYGIYLDVSYDNEFRFNLIKYNTEYGFWVDGDSNTISFNNFIGNRQGNSPQGYDSGANNLFLKNFWADWVNQSNDADGDGFLDDAYQISGLANNNDPQPLSQTNILSSIAINGNSEFFRYVNINGWSGTGTVNDPYIIENYQFDVGGLKPGVSIGNTTVHFIIRNVHVENYESGFYFDNVTNGMLVQNSAIDNVVGYKIEDSWFIAFTENLAFSNNASGIEVYLSHYCDIQVNNITQNSGHGLYVENSIGTSIEFNNVSLNGQNGIYINSFANPSVYTGNDVISNDIFNNTNYGIYTLETQNNLILNNIVMFNWINFWIDKCDGCTVRENTVFGANYGVYLVNTNSSLITSNLIRDAGTYALYLDSNSYSNIIYHNGFYDNFFTAYDDGTGNTWYDINSNEGNLYDSYSGSGPFIIHGSASNQDPYPQPFIGINGPVDFSFPYGSSGYLLTWQFKIGLPGNYPSNYTVFKNNTIIQFGSVSDGNWTSSVILSLEGMSAGLYNYTIMVFNDLGKKAIDIVWITVTPDLVTPSIDSPMNITFEEGSIGYSITWTGNDANPWQAIILLNSTEVYNEYWIGEKVILDLDSLALSAGVYNFTCILIDKSGNQVSDTVIVTIEVLVPDTTYPTLIPPSSTTYIEGTTGNYLTWVAGDAHPFAYQWLVNDTFAGFQPWDGNSFNISIDGLSAGIWNITITVSDLAGNNVTATVFVEVLPIPPDIFAPRISQPATLELYENTPGSIIWEVADDSPDYYIIYRNSTLVVQRGYWVSGIIQYSFTTIPVGTWEFNLTIFDLTGNWNSSSMLVVINPGSEIENIAPVISEMQDLEIDFNVTGTKAIFRVFDENPKTIEVLLDGTQIYYSPWYVSNQKFEVALDHLSIGTYNLTLIAYDMFDNAAFESLIITVRGDSTPPTVSSPDSVKMEVGEQVIVSWTVSDPNLDHYELVILETGELIDSGTFDGTTQTISTTISELSSGEYTLRLIVYDTYGHKTMDDVTLVITDPESTFGTSRASGFEVITLFPLITLGFLFWTRKKTLRKKNERRNQ
ncbi:MAG: NosD domain-containing protein [Candidatus Kariarchaeaceae archaeon]